MILQRTLEAGSSRRRSLLYHRPQEHLWHRLKDLHHQLGDSGVGPFQKPSKEWLKRSWQTGHYVHLCFRGGKPRKRWREKETVKIETEEQSGNTESSNLLSETCFRLQANDAEAEGGSMQLVVSEDSVLLIPQPSITINSDFYDDHDS